jgi:hypothetical protein
MSLVFSICSSTMVFQALQSGHFPIHRGDWLPQD